MHSIGVFAGTSLISTLYPGYVITGLYCIVNVEVE